MLIKEIRKIVTEKLRLKAIMVLVPTGATAVNVEDNIIHSTLKVPTCFKSFADLGNKAEINLQLSMDPTSFLIVQEISMIGCRLMTALDERCRDDKANSIEPFGGLFVYVIEGTRQLQPVKDTPLYKIHSINNILALRGQTSEQMENR